MTNQNKTPRIRRANNKNVAFWDRNALSCVVNLATTDKTVFVVKAGDDVIAVCGDIRTAFHVWKGNRDFCLSIGKTWGSLATIVRMDVLTF